MKNRHTGENLPKGFVRENFYLCYDKDELIGVFSFKFELTEFLLNYGGHMVMLFAHQKEIKAMQLKC